MRKRTHIMHAGNTCCDAYIICIIAESPCIAVGMFMNMCMCLCRTQMKHTHKHTILVTLSFSAILNAMPRDRAGS